MDDKGIGIVLIAVMAVAGLVVVVAAAGGIMYMTDTPISAVVIDKDCGTNPLSASSSVTVKTKFPVPGIEHTIKDFDNGICQGLRAGENGNFAKYYLKSDRTVLYEREGGACLYDSAGIKCGDS